MADSETKKCYKNATKAGAVGSRVLAAEGCGFLLSIIGRSGRILFVKYWQG